MDAETSSSSNGSTESCDLDTLHVSLITLVGLLALLPPLFLLLCGRRIQRARAWEMRGFKHRQDHVQQLCENASVLGFPMCCVSYLSFRDKGRLISHEVRSYAAPHL